MNLIKLIDFPILGDERGGLVALEANRCVPFDIKRVYYIYDTTAGVTRGFHAHKTLKQVAVVVHGSCRFVLDDGNNRVEVLLNNPGQGLLIESFMWREMHDFSHDCVLMVLADQVYDEADYIRDYSQFVEVAKNRVYSPVK
ncbi:sugar 3,4-ketoisomerase [Aeromonas dhakensis]|uniref:dTDP-6-deoxy-3,4-keto-hexulose isomerase n=1 Tax=Aeromonas hydrophila TaxID=644 RepID=X5CCA7_AERHY|nr:MULTISPECIES: FdtA/QdtA family cupin domain-containing protein [Aeromonas]AGM44885.1 WxcM domain-containing protein [Aeromonas hydrophila ML09-119]AHW40527.1 dTDP-6-deoxy-3,4-keto-hexulose isomerase [Aeromonas hydrophila]AHW40554.1 dTDP-6-deoxy-3,4-keto-hexulose isomerase [Aeromonas hydrophila]AID71102.1 dTDP-6-deoxy-3,4-keto-hexulose isomerase [Aeromonas hydrophila]AID71129.1 dTDP-6-deoxy-3,4-keto-hexulose isomerase [Aeromonas hydrophila]